MRNWLAYVRNNLANPSSRKQLDDNTARELAQHLEDSYNALLASGASEENAYRLACQQVGNWQELRAGILAAKREGAMENRVTQLWVPGVATFAAAAAFLALFDFLGVRHFIFNLGQFPKVDLHVSWLAVLPLVGALGAFLGHRAHADRTAISISSLFPALVMATVMFLVFVGAFFLDRPVSAQMATIGFWPALLNWVILPAIALSLGSWAFQLIQAQFQARKTSAR
jgi:hypothetical protein